MLKCPGLDGRDAKYASREYARDPKCGFIGYRFDMDSRSKRWHPQDLRRRQSGDWRSQNTAGHNGKNMSKIDIDDAPG